MPTGTVWLTAYALETAIQAVRPLEIDYEAADGERTTRTIEPYELTVARSGGWLVRAMDHLRLDTRTFRVDRILAVRQTTCRITLLDPERAALARIRAEIALVDPYGYRDDAATWTPEPIEPTDLFDSPYAR